MKTAMDAFDRLDRLEVRKKALDDIHAAETSGADNADERIALAYLAMEKECSREMLSEYRDELTTHAIAKGYGPTFYEDLASNLILDGAVSR